MNVKRSALALLASLVAAPSAAGIVEISHKDLQQARSHNVQYFCIEPEDVPQTYRDPNSYNLSRVAREPRVAGSFMFGAWTYTIFLADNRCLDEVMAAIMGMRQLEETDFVIAPVTE